MESYFLSKDKKQSLLTIFPNKEVNNYEINKIIKNLKSIKSDKFKIYIGGQSALGYDFIEKL